MKVVLHPGQLDVANDNHRFKVICSGRRWGKSTLAELIVLKWALETVGIFWIVSPTYRAGKMIHWRQLSQIIPQAWIAKKNEVELSITLKNGSIIELKGAENPDALRGVKLRGLVIDEIASIRNWDWLWQEVLRPTLTDYSSPALFISTPKGYNHFFTLFEMEKENKDYKAWQFSSYDNPYIPKTEIDTAKLEIGADVFAQEYMAVFTRFTGLVYKEFDVDKHVHYFDHDKNAYGDYYFGLDFAVRGYTASVASIIKPSGDIYILDNYKKDNETAQVHGKAMQEMLELYADFSKYTGYADPAGFAKTQQGFKENQQMTWSLADEYTEQGFPIVPANNEVAAGINYVRQLFLQDKIHIHPRCADLIDEIQQYQWKDQPLTQIGTHTQPEEVRKINDHICFCRHTKILTRTGYKDIIDVEVNDYVWTPIGWSKVLKKERTGKQKVYAFQSTKATSNHPFLTQDGFHPLKELKVTDKLWNVFTSKESSIDAIQIQQRFPIRGILGVVQRMIQVRLATYTSKYGHTSTGISQRVATSTIKILTTIETISRILKWSVIPSIKQGTLNQLNKRLSEEGMLGKKKHENGTKVKRVRYGTQLMQKKHGLIRKCMRWTAKIVGINIQPTSLKDQSSVALTVKCQCSENVEVYNLVTDTGMYTAGTVVVSNCDGLRYMLYSKPISPEELEPKRKTLFPVQFEMKLDIQDSDENKTGDQIEFDSFI